MGGFVPTVRNTMSNYPSSGGTPYGTNPQLGAAASAAGGAMAAQPDGNSPAQSNGAQLSSLPGPRLDPSAYFTGSGGGPSLVGQWSGGASTGDGPGSGVGPGSGLDGMGTAMPSVGQPGYNPADPNENPWAGQDFGGGGAVGHKLGDPGYDQFDPNDNPDAGSMYGGGMATDPNGMPHHYGTRDQYGNLRTPPGGDIVDLGSMGGGAIGFGQPVNEDPGMEAPPTPDVGQGDKNRMKQAMRHMQRGGGGIMGKPGGKMGGPPGVTPPPGGIGGPPQGPNTFFPPANR